MGKIIHPEGLRASSGIPVYLYLGGMIVFAVLARLGGYNPVLEYLFIGYLTFPLLPLFRAKYRAEFDAAKESSAVYDDLEGRNSIFLEKATEGSYVAEEMESGFVLRSPGGWLPSVRGYLQSSGTESSALRWEFEITRFRIRILTVELSVIDEEERCRVIGTWTTMRMPLLLMLTRTMDRSSLLEDYGYTLESWSLRPELL